jgi:hypothetical protein
MTSVYFSTSFTRWANLLTSVYLSMLEAGHPGGGELARVSAQESKGGEGRKRGFRRMCSIQYFHGSVGRTCLLGEVVKRVLPVRILHHHHIRAKLVINAGSAV